MQIAKPASGRSAGSAQLAAFALGFVLSGLVTSPVYAEGAASGAASSASASAPSLPNVPDPSRWDTPAASTTTPRSAGPASDTASVPKQIQFGHQAVGSTSVPKLVKLPGGSSATRVTSDVTATGAFAVSPAKCELVAGGSCGISVTFSPTQFGATEGAVVVSDASTGSRILAELTGTGSGRCDESAFLVCHGHSWDIVPVALLVAIYLAALLAVRWNNIAFPTRGLLLAEILAVEARVATLTAAAGPADIGLAQIDGLLKAASAQVPVTGIWAIRWDILFWSRGRESAGWGLVHEAEEQLAVFLDQEQVRAALERAQAELREATTTQATGLADRIQAELGRTVVSVGDHPVAILQELSDFVHLPPVDLRAALAAVLSQNPAPMAAACSAVADRIVGLLSPHAASLTVQVTAALTSLPPMTPVGFRTLLEEARDVILPKASGLATSLSTTAPPALASDWQAKLAAASDYLALTDLYASRLQGALGASPVVPLARWRALLSEALGIIYQERDMSFSTLMSWHNKASWMTNCGLLLILALSAALGNEVLFLLGAAGGLLSRLSRSLYRQDVPTDYGASWTTLFLSPVAGALGGWTGVLLVALLEKLGVLGPLLDSIRWDSPYNALAYGVAFLFGFSERAFNTVLSQLEDKVISMSGQTGSALSKLTIATTSPLKAGQSGQQYDAALTASGGKPAFIWLSTSGTLPRGLRLDPTGKLTGVPSGAAQTYKFTLQVKDSVGGIDSRDFNLAIAGGAPGTGTPGHAALDGAPASGTQS